MSEKEKSVLCLGSAGFHVWPIRSGGAQCSGDPGLRPWVDAQRLHFDTAAAALEDGYRVICPDIMGRGQSDWLTDGTL